MFSAKVKFEKLRFYWI